MFMVNLMIFFQVNAIRRQIHAAVSVMLMLPMAMSFVLFLYSSISINYVNDKTLTSFPVDQK